MRKVASELGSPVQREGMVKKTIAAMAPVGLKRTEENYASGGK
jgi:hypothetical protein